MSNKKINCKHGLTNKEEIEARRLKNKLLENDKEVIAQMEMLFLEWLKEDRSKEYMPIYFSWYIKEKNIKVKVRNYLTRLLHDYQIY